MKILFVFVLVSLAGVFSNNDVYAQYMGNVGSKNETEQYTLKEALEIQKKKIVSEPKEKEITCGTGTHLDNSQCVPNTISKPEPKSTTICNDGTKLENGICPDKQFKSTTDSKNGLWLKYKIKIDVHTANYPKPINNDQMLEEFLLNSFYSNLSSTTWQYMSPKELDFITVDHIQFSDVVVTNNYATTKEGKEFFIGTITSNREDYALDFKDRKIGETIKTHEGIYMKITDFTKNQIGEKQVDVVVLENEKISELGASLKMQSIYHKQTGILLSIILDIIGNAYAPDERLSASFTAIEISDEFVEKSSLGGGCLIATATYGSELAPQVQQLRELRDNSLLQTASGTSFMAGFNQFYYSFSPTIADWERENPTFKEAVKITLIPMISSLSILNYVDMDSEESVLGYGISLIILNVGMYFVAPFVVVHSIKKKF